MSTYSEAAPALRSHFPLTHTLLTLCFVLCMSVLTFAASMTEPPASAPAVATLIR